MEPQAPTVRAAGPERRRGRPPYAELHCHSNFSFLDGASHPEELAEEAARLDLVALALTDHDGLYGVVRFAEAARAVGLPTVFAEITLLREVGISSGWSGGEGDRAPGRRLGRRPPAARDGSVRSSVSRILMGSTSCCWPTVRRGTPGCPVR